MGQPSNSTSSVPHARPLWRRIIAAQESGLIVVIALMMAALAIFGGSKTDTTKVVIPAGVAHVVLNETELRVSWPDGEQTYRSGRSVRIREGDAGGLEAFITQQTNKFLDAANLLNVLTTASFYAVMAVGMTAIIILAGIDLSVGSVYALAAILGASAISRFDPSASAWIAVPTLIAVCCAVGAVAGFVNGFSSVALRVHPFIITLGTMAIFRGLVFVYTGGQTISGLPESIQGGFFKFEFKGVYPVPTLIMLFVALAGVVVLGRTVFGRRVFAIGGNETAATYAGIPVGRVKTIVYTLAGALAGLAAAIYVGFYGAAENGAGQGYELNVIAAAVIGGASLSGGRGSAFGAVLGAILVQLINNGMLILDIDQSYNQIVMGLAIIIAVVVDQAKTRLSK